MKHCIFGWDVWRKGVPSSFSVAQSNKSWIPWHLKMKERLSFETLGLPFQRSSITFEKIWIPNHPTMKKCYAVCYTDPQTFVLKGRLGMLILYLVSTNQTSVLLKNFRISICIKFNWSPSNVHGMRTCSSKNEIIFISLRFSLRSGRKLTFVGFGQVLAFSRKLHKDIS
jgi:hypothetical protein